MKVLLVNKFLYPKGGAEIVELLQTGSAFYAPAASVVSMVECFLTGHKRILTAAVHAEGEYGLDGVYVGLPACLGKGGLDHVVELSLTDEELSALHASAEQVRSVAQSLGF